jgi:predicted RNase H-like nuclease
MTGRMIAVGLDGYSKGWVAVRVDGAKRELYLLESISELPGLKFDRAGVDIPIGLPDRGERACDLQARAMLRPHASRVFTGARRGLWRHPTYGGANIALKARGEKGVSVQLWRLGPKIAEVDAFVTAHLQRRIREVHPELVFLRLNFGRPLPAKRSDEGLSLRVRLLRRQGFADIKRWTEAARGGVKADDIVDACAVAIAARDFGQGNVLPRDPAPKDAKGLKMQIWF